MGVDRWPLSNTNTPLIDDENGHHRQAGDNSELIRG